MSTLEGGAIDRFALSFQRGQIIFCEHEIGTDFFMLKSGRVKLMKVVGELEKTVGVLTSGDFFGEMALLGQVPRNATAIALEPTVLLAFNKQNFEVMVQGNPTMSIKLLNIFAQRIHEQKRQFAILQIDDENIRIAAVLVMLSDNLNPNDGSYKRVLQVTIESVANWAGISPESAHKVLNSYADQNKIELYPDHIIIANINEFTRIVNSKRSI